MPTFELEIVTPVGSLYSGVIESLRAPGSNGGFGVLSRHHPMVAALGVGQLILREEGGQERRASVSGGFAEVLHNHVTVLAETAEFPEAVDVARAEAARKRSKDRLSGRRDMDLDVARAEASLARAINRLRIAGSGA